MKILLCAINSKYIHSTLGIHYLYSAYQSTSSNHTVELYESTINNSKHRVIEDIYNHMPDVIGFSTYIWNIEYVLMLIDSIKKILPNVIIYLGGPQATFDFHNLLEHNANIEFISMYEGENAFIQLLANNFNYKDCCNIAYRNKQEIVVNDNKELCRYFNPYTDKYMSMLNSKIAYIETSRGCPFSCAFCLSGRKDNVRYFDIDICKDNIVKLANSGSKTIKFVDRTFNANAKRSDEILQFILDKFQLKEIPSDICFHFEIAADLLNEKSLEFIKKFPPGLIQFEAGLQSFNNQTLSEINRATNIEKLVSNLKLLAGFNNNHLHIDLIAGLPLEDYESFQKGFNLAYEINADVIQVGFLKLLHGSKLRQEMDSYNYKCSDYSPYEILENDFISYSELNEIHLMEDVVDKLYNSNKFKDSLKYILKSMNIEPYNLFLDFAFYLKKHDVDKCSQENYAKHLYNFCLSNGLNQQILRDTMCLDKMRSDKFGRVYAFLHNEDEKLGIIKKMMKDKNSMFHKYLDLFKKGLVGMFISYTDNTLYIFDYSIYNTAKNEYEYEQYPLNII